MNKFENVDLGNKTVAESIKRFRQQLASNLQDLIDDGEILPDTSVAEVIKILRMGIDGL